MTDIATHVRIFDTAPDDDLVTKRTAAIKDLASRHNKSKAVPVILQSANDLALAVEAKGKVSDALSNDIQAAIRKAGAEAFVASEQPLQVTVVALLAAQQALANAAPTSGTVTSVTVLAAGLWSALSFQPPRTEAKVESLRSEVMALARENIIASATTSRERIPVAEAEVAPAKELNPESVAQSVNAGLKTVINALRTNAAIDREEIDLLWWVMAEWSELLKRRYSAAPDSVGTVLASGIEAGRMLRRMPGDAHRNLVLRHVTGTAPVSLAEVLTSLGDERLPMASLYAADQTLAACPAVFPLLTALTSGSASHAKNKSKRKISEWAERALLESATLHVTTLLPVKV